MPLCSDCPARLSAPSHDPCKNPGQLSNAQARAPALSTTSAGTSASCPFSASGPSTAHSVHARAATCGVISLIPAAAPCLVLEGFTCKPWERTTSHASTWPREAVTCTEKQKKVFAVQPWRRTSQRLLIARASTASTARACVRPASFPGTPCLVLRAPCLFFRHMPACALPLFGACARDWVLLLT